MRLLSLCSALLFTAVAAAQPYPETPRGDVVDTYHGVKVADPYRWLEDVDAPEVAKWVVAQNRVTRQALDHLPGRQALRERLTALWDYEKFDQPVQVGDELYYRYNDGLQNQSVLVRERADRTRQVVLDPNTLSAEGTAALTSWQVSPDGRWLAYGVAQAGSDWNRFYVRNLVTGRDDPQVLDYIKFSGMSWTHDGAGFYYSRYPTPKTQETDSDGVFGELNNQAVYYHRRGTEQAHDIPIYARPDQPQWGFGAEVSNTGDTVLIAVWKEASDTNALYARSLKSSRRPHVRGPLIPIVTHFKSRYEPIGMVGTQLYMLTTDQAPRGRIVQVDLNRPKLIKPVLAQGADTIESARLVGDALVVVTLKDASSRLSIHALDGSLRHAVALPGVGSVASVEPDAEETGVFLMYSSYLQASQQMHLDLASGKLATRNQARVAFDASRFITEQVFYSSADGTQVPMFITRRKDLAPDRAHPTYLYGYGGFNISLTPSFKSTMLSWLEQGGIYAVANLRGGGEYGEAWHEAGTLAHKQRVFDDFIAAGEYLIKQGWASPRTLAIVGRSNGGLLVGAVSNQRPDLFAAGIAGVGVMDMLRFHKFTIGWAWVGDYGSSDDKAMFPVLKAYSPYHNVTPSTRYPAMLVTTGDHDDRVVPGHSYKYAAALQAARPEGKPQLIRIETRAGHGRGTPTDKQIDQAVDELAFLGAYTGLSLQSRIPWFRMR